jgi:hypothetical protein
LESAIAEKDVIMVDLKQKLDRMTGQDLFIPQTTWPIFSTPALTHSSSSREPINGQRRNNKSTRSSSKHRAHDKETREEIDKLADYIERQNAKKPLSVRINGLNKITDSSTEAVTRMVHALLGVVSNVSSVTITDKKDKFVLSFKVPDIDTKKTIIKTSAEVRPEYTNEAGITTPIFFDNDFTPFQRKWNHMVRMKARIITEDQTCSIDKWNCRIWIDGSEVQLRDQDGRATDSNRIPLGQFQLKEPSSAREVEE